MLVHDVYDNYIDFSVSNINIVLITTKTICTNNWYYSHNHECALTDNMYLVCFNKSITTLVILINLLFDNKHLQFTNII